MIFNHGSAEPLGSASICQGFHSWPVINNLACEITPDNVVEIFSTESFVRNCISVRLFLYRRTVLKFLLLVFMAYLDCKPIIKICYNVGPLCMT